MFLAVTVFLWVAYLGFAKTSVEIANHEINSSVVAYFNALNKKNYKELDKILYPTDNAEYVLTIAAKAQAVGTESIRLHKIYPALVDRNIAVVGFEYSVNNLIENQRVTFKRTNLFFMLKNKGNWYVAKPNDLDSYSAEYLSAMIDKYDSVIRENMTDDAIKEQKYYNDIGFKKIKNAANQS